MVFGLGDVLNDVKITLNIQDFHRKMLMDQSLLFLISLTANFEIVSILIGVKLILG